MNTDRRVILGLIAMGRITPAEAERLLAEGTKALKPHESGDQPGDGLPSSSQPAFACGDASVPLRRVLLPTSGCWSGGHGFQAGMHFFNAQVPALAEAARKALSPITGPITDLTPLTRVEGLL